ncbi:hypothetical protein [Haloferula sp. BvORR071]|uniref:hypothetical protein n=1 Tax=Haloferula sp. BvORR071 TaxID=1396141 RepID=UPI002240F01A|nr:hypothetical protein [Haloferula sp. BvORR071]
MKELEEPRPPSAAFCLYFVVQQFIEQCSGIRSILTVRGPEVSRWTGKSGRAKAAGVAVAIARAAIAMLKVLVFIFLVSVG